MHVPFKPPFRALAELKLAGSKIEGIAEEKEDTLVAVAATQEKAVAVLPPLEESAKCSAGVDPSSSAAESNQLHRLTTRRRVR